MNQSAAPRVSIYVGVYLALLVLTTVTVAVAFLPLGRLNAVVALAVAGLKSVAIALIFMHVRWAPRLIWLVAAGALFWVLVLVLGTLGDIVTRY